MAHGHWTAAIDAGDDSSNTFCQASQSAFCYRGLEFSSSVVLLRLHFTIRGNCPRCGAPLKCSTFGSVVSLNPTGVAIRPLTMHRSVTLEPSIGWQKSCFSVIKDVVFIRTTFQKQITVKIAYTFTPQAVCSIAVTQEQHSIKVVPMVDNYHFFSLFYNFSIKAVSFRFKYAVLNIFLSSVTTVKIQKLS